MKLEEYGKLTVQEQQALKFEIMDAFQQFIWSNPTEKDFEEQMSGIVLFPEMLYHIYRGPQ